MDRMNNYSNISTADARNLDVGKLMAAVYQWMTVGLAITAVTSMLIARSDAALNIIFGTRGLPMILFFGELGLVFYMSAKITKLSSKAAGMLFYLYSALNGVTMSVIFVMYTQSSIASAFFATAGTFGAMSLYGYVTKKDLTGWGSFLIMGLFGIIIASIVNIFLQSSAMVWMINYIGVFLFVGLTAYDTQKIKNMMLTDTEGIGFTNSNKAIYGALILYLDFINLFLFILRIVGGRRD